MEGLAFGLGALLAVFGPLLLLPVTWLVYRLATRRIVATLVPRATAGRSRWLSLALALALVGGALALSYLPGKRAFDALCATHGVPEVLGRVHVDGVFMSRLYPYEAARVLDSFVWVEAPDPYERGVHVRYSRAGDDVHEQRVAALRSRYGVRNEFAELDHGVLIDEKTVYELATGRQLARAASVTYPGGPLSLLLGVWSMSSCPDPSTKRGARDFRIFYDLETIVLRADQPSGGGRHPEPR